MNGATFSAIDLSSLPAPDVVEALDYETILGAMKQDLVARDPSFSALLESDPAMKVLEVAAYRELNLRQHINDSARAVMLAHAVGSDLDNLAANLNVQRLVVAPGNPEAQPPVAATYEDDASLRRRAQLAMEGLSTAGPAGSYIFHALSVPGVADAAVQSSRPGVVDVAVLGTSGDGTPSPELLEAVTTKLNDELVRPLTDTVNVLPALLLRYRIQAELVVYSGPDGEVVRQAAQTAATSYVEQAHAFGRVVSISAVYAALHREGVRSVQLTEPQGDIVPTFSQVPFCEEITLTWRHYDG